MRKTLIPIIVLVLLLSACAPEAPPQPTATQAPPVVNEEPTANTQPEPTPTTEDMSIPETGDETQRITLTIVPEESKVTYEVGETFINDNNRFQVAVGVTNTIEGQVYANPENPPLSQIGTIQINIRDFQSDSNRRDNAIRGQWLESEKYPLATFVPTEINNLPESYTPGEPYTFTVTGDLSIRDTTKAVTFDVTATYDGITLSGSAVTTLLLSDFGAGPISIFGILNTEDEAKITFEFVARP